MSSSLPSRRKTDGPPFHPQNFAADPRHTQKLVEIAKRTNRSMSFWIREAVRRLVEDAPPGEESRPTPPTLDVTPSRRRGK